MTVPNPTMVHILKIATAALGILWNTASVNSALSNLRYMSIMVVAIPISRGIFNRYYIFSRLVFQVYCYYSHQHGYKRYKRTGKTSALLIFVIIPGRKYFSGLSRVFIITESQKLPISSIKILEIKPTTVPAIKSTPNP